MPVIEIRDLTKKFDKITALNAVTLNFNKGINIVLGPNGAGKSTLLRCISGLYRPDKGRISVFGRDPYVDDDLKMRLSFLSDNYALYDYLSVKDNLLFFGRLYGFDDALILKRVKSVLKELNAMDYLNAKVYTLSRGTKQKIAFCRAILNDPEVLLLDEPTAFLDVNASDSVREIITNYAKASRIIIFVTQRIDEIMRLEGRLTILNKGKVALRSSTSKIYNFITKDLEITVIFARPLAGSIAMDTPGFISGNSANPTLIKVRINSYKDINKVIKQLINNGAQIVSVHYIEPAIEKLFKKGSR